MHPVNFVLVEPKSINVFRIIHVQLGSVGSVLIYNTYNFSQKQPLCLIRCSLSNPNPNPQVWNTFQTNASASSLCKPLIWSDLVSYVNFANQHTLHDNLTSCCYYQGRLRLPKRNSDWLMNWHKSDVSVSSNLKGGTL